MPGRRGIARRSPTLRRIKRVKEKYVVPSTVRRFKVMALQPTDPMPKELDWELDVLDVLEQQTYAELEDLGVPSDQWNYYLGFQKRLWERRVKFNNATFQLEKTSLVTEYTLRGLDPTVLGDIQEIAEELGEAKRKGVLPPPPAPPGFSLVYSWQSSRLTVTYLGAFREDPESEVAMAFSGSLIGSKQSSVVVTTTSSSFQDDSEAVLP